MSADELKSLSRPVTTGRAISGQNGRSDSKDRTTRGGDILSQLDAKIARGEKLTNGERPQRQGAIFNHSGKCDGKIVVSK